LSNGDRLYTTSAEEKNSAIGSGGKDEGIVGYIATSQQPGTEPLYRLRNSKDGTYLFTTSPAELASATAQGYRQEGITGYMFTS
jgi:hypothetical protein